MFPKGVSSLKQLAGKDHRALQWLHVPVVAHAPNADQGGVGSNRLTKATRAILDCMFLAQYQVHTDKTIADYEASYKEFHQHKEVYKKIWDYEGFLVWHQEQTTKERQRAALEESLEDNLLAANNALQDEEEHQSGTDEEEGSGDEEQAVWVNETVIATSQANGTTVQGHGTSTLSFQSAQSSQSHPIGWATDRLLDSVSVPRDTIQVLFTPLSYSTRRPSPLLNAVESYAISKQPSFSSVNFADLLRDVNLPDFLCNLARHPYFGTLPFSIDALTDFYFWDSFRVRIPTSQFAPEPRLARIYAISGLKEHRTVIPKPGPTPRSDAVFYLPCSDPDFNHADAKLHDLDTNYQTLADYRVGRLVLIFSLALTTEVPIPRLMAYVERFTAISKKRSGVSGPHAVAKSTILGRTRYECVFLDQIIRPCPLAPIINGPAERGIEGHESLSYYNSFYINKYRHPRDFAWLHQLQCPAS
ncbi:hypothetical protein RSOLAG22IIIB_11042 [Rhizoctonia solani]|uniref:Uncharacterized protein n=1 Tax=Rhizoctonia solani TaxID=456999 RepID=A0A0K6G6F2_9AGAM|nr:hypothetical protein RSOLAG22IIIB_11042 [Rhizoctonia solani]